MSKLPSRWIVAAVALSLAGVGCSANNVTDAGQGGGGGGSSTGGGHASGGGSGSFDGGTAIRFGATMGWDGLYAPNPVDPNLRTVAIWVRMRVALNGRQETCWSIENAAPSNAYQLMISTFNTDQWEAHDQ